jgi:hypothetical protein
MCVKELSKTMCTVADDECLIKVDFKFQENEDNQFCWWEFYRFEDKFYTFEDMEVFFQRIRNKHEDAFIGLENDYRFTITNKAKACGVVVRASDSQLGDPGSNLGSAKSLSMIG